MSQSKQSNKRGSVKGKSVSQWKSHVGQPPFKEIIQKAFHDMKHSMGFTREAVLNHITTHYGIQHKKKPMLQINAALRNGVKHGTLERTSGKGVLGIFRLVEKTTRANPQTTKHKRLIQRGKPDKSSEVLKTNKKIPVLVPVDRKSSKLGLRRIKTTKKAKLLNSREPRTARKHEDDRQIASTSDCKETFGEKADAAYMRPSHPEQNKTATLIAPVVKNVSEDTWKSLSFLPKRCRTIENEPDVGFHVSGMVPLSDGRIVIADNNSIKVYSPDMTTSPDFTLTADQLKLNLNSQERITDIANFNETIAVVIFGFAGSKIHFVDISSEPLSVCQSLKTDCLAHGITACHNYMYITAICGTPSVKKIGRNGKVYWSVSCDQKGNALFKLPYDIHSFAAGYSVRLVMTDNSRPKTVTLLDGETGNVLAVRRSLDTMRGVTTDHFNNIFICHWALGLVSVMPADLSDERVILTTEEKAKKFRKALSHDLDTYPENIAFDQRTNSLFITSGSCGKLRGQIQIYQFC